MHPNPVLDLSRRLTVLPVVHGSAQFALEVRRRLHEQPCDCLAVPLPPSFAAAVEQGVGLLPRVSLAVQADAGLQTGYSFVPVDPCQPVIAALREALAAGIPCAWVDLEVSAYEEHGLVLPDPYALREVPLERLLAALLPALPPPPEGSQRQQRQRRMAWELHRLELEYEHVVFVCSVADWPWVRQAYLGRLPYPSHSRANLPRLAGVAESALYFVLGELPYVTHLHEHRRAELLSAEPLAVDGVKALLLEARDLWQAQAQLQEPWLTPQVLGLLLTYVRNLTLMDGRLTPDLYNLVLGAKQVVGDDFALALVECACRYPPQRMPSALEAVAIGLGRMADPEGRPRPCANRLQGVPRVWRRLPLRRRPPPPCRREWSLLWDPLGQVSHPPEDARIESFQQHVREQARQLVGEAEARTEKFTASLKDGLDIRETLRNWHRGQLWVREVPPGRGSIEVVVFLFETPADPDRYTWCSTWYAEHAGESTLSFFATHFRENMVGPGIGQALYGGCLFLYPPRTIPDIWVDPRFAEARTLEERLLSGALFHSQGKRVVLVAPRPPELAWRHLARRLGRQLVYLPLKRFSAPTVDRLRRFHVLNGRHVRSYAARYIRDLR
ncbi:MAG: hypothetical protein AB1505_12140 [Candidatus Latescibacterota bacterium]